MKNKSELENKLYKYWIDNGGSLSKLVRYICSKITYEEYSSLEGGLSADKAKNLVEKWTSFGTSKSIDPMKEFIIGRTYQLKSNNRCKATYTSTGWGSGVDKNGLLSDDIFMNHREDWCLLAETVGEAKEKQESKGIRTFGTGANRNSDEGKLDFEGFLSPTVLKKYAEYMHKMRHLENGEYRDSDNWQKGIPVDAYMKSMYRHFFDVWSNHRGIETKENKETNLCALLFNVMGMLHETLKEENE